MSLFDRIALATLPLLPRPLMRSLASRYIAGETLESALAKLAELRGRGFEGIVDLLGEDVTKETEARAVAATYAALVDAIVAAGMHTYVSIKPTHVGLRLSEELADELYAGLVHHCQPHGIFLRVEMEDHTTTDATLRVFERLREISDRVGLVLQSRLLRTLEDIDRLAPGPLDVRMVKGIYLEPASVAHVDVLPIRKAFVECTKRLFERGAVVAMATHDEILAEELFLLCEDMRVEPERHELRVLLGVRERLWQSWQRAGRRVRVYVPYGPEWRAYSTRRLKRNPQILRHVMRDLFMRR